MQITLAWHLILMVVITIILMLRMFSEQDSGLDLSSLFFGTIIVVIWLIYGGIAWW